MTVRVYQIFFISNMRDPNQRTKIALKKLIDRTECVQQCPSRHDHDHRGLQAPISRGLPSTFGSTQFGHLLNRSNTPIYLLH